jgi:hypothetical protein
LKVKSAIYPQFTPFSIFHPKVPSKHKTKNIKAFDSLGESLICSRMEGRLSDPGVPGCGALVA